MKLKGQRNGILICLVGIDGAGKSTLARALVTDMEEQGMRSRYVWGGFASSFTIFRPLIGVMKATVFRGNRHMEVSDAKGRVAKSSLLSTIYQYVMLLDYFLQASARISLPLMIGSNVICDRYIYDLVTSIALILEYPIDRTSRLLHRCLVFLPEPELVFLLDVPETLAYRRKDDIVSLDFLTVRRNIYLELARQEGMTILDGSRDKEELQQLVAARVLPLITGEP